MQHAWDRDAYKDSVGKLEGSILFERHRHRWGKDIKMDRKEVGWKDVCCMNVAQHGDRRLALVHGGERLGSTKCGEFLD